MSRYSLYRESESSPYTRRQYRWGVVTDNGSTVSRLAVGSRSAARAKLQELRVEESSSVQSGERHYCTRRGFLRACKRYRSRILAYISQPTGKWTLVLTKVQP